MKTADISYLFQRKHITYNKERYLHTILFQLFAYDFQFEIIYQDFSAKMFMQIIK